jgi:hypothetical protein
VLYCLPVAMLLFLLVTRVLAAPVARHVPRRGSFRLHELAFLEAQPRTLRHLANVAACILAGGGTHLAWDLFTHDGSWMGDYIPWLHERVVHVGGHGVRGTNVLWILSTVFGGLFTIVTLRRIGARSLVRRWAEERLPGSTASIDAESPPALSHVAFWAPVVVVTLGAAVLVYLGRPAGFYPLDKATWVIVFLRSAALGFVALSFSAWRERRAWRHRSSGAGRGTTPRAVDAA